MVYLESTYISDATLDYLRLIQILRLFHMDRQMTTWHLIKNMVILSKWELLAAYYITFILCLLMVNLIYISENEGFIFYFPLNSSEVTKSEEFLTLAHAWWFTVVTIPTIGYGDIVPEKWTSKVIVCFLGFLAYCTFVAASTQISVGLTLMMEENSKKECKNKLRNTSASVIQFWYRFHLASSRSRRLTEYFRRICLKLYITARRMNRNRQMEHKLREKLERKKKQRNTVAANDQTWKEQLSMGVAQQMIQTFSLDVQKNRKNPPLKGNLSLPETVSDYKNIDVAEKGSSEISSMFERRGSTDTNLSSSFDISDIEAQIDMNNLYDDERSDSVDISGVEEWRLYKYRPLLRFFNFLLFRQYAKKFRRLRKSDRLLEFDAEVREQENVRHQHLRELELRVNAMLGKPGVSSLAGSNGEKLCMARRLDLCESKMTDMEEIMKRINDLVTDLSSILQHSPAREALPPIPPSRHGQHYRRRCAFQRPSAREDYSDRDE
ncbi:Potassium channel KvQLT family [Trichostrongylus colubriformis]|uniref:Potassium channel KvQLT family n=1 Tax=Trichostrongylus colubriformis TaxID=6319 RepID=A0AAN8F7B0_TRICO